MTDEKILAVLEDIRNWTRAASHSSVKATLERALQDPKSRRAYQMLDGDTSMDSVRIACRMSPNALQLLAERCTSMGLMGINDAKKRVRLFDLTDFGLMTANDPETKEKDERQTKKK